MPVLVQDQGIKHHHVLVLFKAESVGQFHMISYVRFVPVVDVQMLGLEIGISVHKTNILAGEKLAKAHGFP